ncbi:hypothetical protein [Thiorhodococcus minor]|uniref:Uncharacterized protein n=1 Tax=Thiorhodococcus minor TaxID=57489 RepID=A0A6M0JXF9_9GAMM|nr:hypothetical protein [Thiorhodococcus minor]NEV61661.1 hypothetical protein [Thiorhodococcus minor]
MTRLQSRVDALERQAGLSEVPCWVRELPEDDRVFYLAIKKREAGHPKGFEGLVRTLDEPELERLIAILLGHIDKAEIPEELRAEVEELRERAGR